jgi:hypothetical protein
MNEENVKTMIACQRINDQLLSAIDFSKNVDNITLKQILDPICRRYEKGEKKFRNKHCFFNQYQMISSLYTSLVLPEEVFFNSIPEKIKTNSLNHGWGIRQIDPPCELKNFIFRLRGAVSQGNIEISENREFIFSDIQVKNKNDVFRIKLSGEQLSLFTQALAYWCLTKDMDLKDL